MAATLSMAVSAIRIPIGGRTWLGADIAVPPDARGVILFAHGDGSSRHSPRNRFVASALNFLLFTTVLADLLTPQEERRDLAELALLGNRVVQLIDWVRANEPAAKLPIGLFGMGTGAAAALDGAAARPGIVRALVSRGGRPDLATKLDAVRAPTLLIAEGNDTEVLERNQAALARLTCTKELRVVPEEEAASAAGLWFERYVVAPKRGSQR